MTKPVWSHVLVLTALPNIPDCVRYIIGVFHKNGYIAVDIRMDIYLIT